VLSNVTVINGGQWYNFIVSQTHVLQDFNVNNIISSKSNSRLSLRWCQALFSSFPFHLNQLSNRSSLFSLFSSQQVKIFLGKGKKNKLNTWFPFCLFKGLDWIWDSASYWRERGKSFRSCGCCLLFYATELCVLHPNQARCFISLSWPLLCSLYYLFGDMYSRKWYFVDSLWFLTIIISSLDRDKYISCSVSSKFKRSWSMLCTKYCFIFQWRVFDCLCVMKGPLLPLCTRAP
jgi:hypothetical protein